MLFLQASGEGEDGGPCSAGVLNGPSGRTARGVLRSGIQTRTGLTAMEEGTEQCGLATVAAIPAQDSCYCGSICAPSVRTVWGDPSAAPDE